MHATSFIHPSPEVILGQDSQHVFDPLLPLFRDLIKFREIDMELRSLNDKFQKVFHIETFYLRAVRLFDLIILYVLFLAHTDLIQKVPILVI